MIIIKCLITMVSGWGVLETWYFWKQFIIHQFSIQLPYFARKADHRSDTFSSSNSTNFNEILSPNISTKYFFALNYSSWSEINVAHFGWIHNFQVIAVSRNLVFHLDNRPLQYIIHQQENYRYSLHRYNTLSP